jgi:hypothetical protein
VASPFDQLVGIIYSKTLDAWKGRNAQAFATLFGTRFSGPFLLANLYHVAEYATASPETPGHAAQNDGRLVRLSRNSPCVFWISNQLYSALFQAPQQSRHPERSASQICRIKRALWRGVEGPRRCLLADALGSFSAANYNGS